MPDPKISRVSCLGGCENSIAEQAPSPGGNLPSNRYLTRCLYSLRYVWLYSTRFSEKSKGARKKISPPPNAVRAPTPGGAIDPRRESETGPGGHTARPYEKTEGGSVGAACMAARKRPRFPTAPSPNAVGRHAHMPPWTGARCPQARWSRRCGPGADTMRAYGGKRQQTRL